MRHPTEGVLRRLVDEPAGVSDPDREHVRDCPVRLVGLAAAREDAGTVASALCADPTRDLDVSTAGRRPSSALTPERPTRARAPRSPRRAALLRRPAAAALAVGLVLA